MIVEITFPLPFEKKFHYKIPENLKNKIKPGIRVIVPFGHSSKKEGLVFSIVKDEINLKNIKVKEIIDIIDEDPLYDFDKLKKIVFFISRKWFSPFNMVFKYFFEPLPKKIKYYEEKEFKTLKNNKLSNDILNKFSKNEKDILLKTTFPFEEMMEIAIAKANKNQQTLFLFPDILSLSYFYLRFLENKYSFDIHLYGSFLSLKEKKEIFYKVKNNEIKILAGLKSSLFLPFNKNSLFVITNEHNRLYSQFDQHPFYEAIEVAEKISEIFDYEIIKIDSSFSIKSIIKEEENKKTIIDLIDKKENVNLKIIDMKKYIKTPFSIELLDEIKKEINLNKKIFLIASNKGMYSKIFCPSCGWAIRCPDCNRKMRVFKDKEGKNYCYCSYCNKKIPYENKCYKCSLPMLVEKGYGTQKISQELKNIFTDKKILEIDSNIINKNFNKAKELALILLKGDYDIVVGTSVILNDIFKRKDIGMVSFFDLNPDENNLSFNETEINVQKLLTAKELLPSEGKIIVQTEEIENPVFSSFNEYDNFIKEEIDSRKFFLYPPFADVVRIEFKSKNIDILKIFVKNFSSSFSDNLKKDLKILDYRYSKKIILRKTYGIYYHKNDFKINSKEERVFSNYILNLKIPKEIEISITNNK